MKILVVGSINMDLVTYMDTLPRQGETIFGHDFLQNPGGKGANQACAASLLGGDVTMLGAVGNDTYGKQLAENLSQCHVKPELKLSSLPTGCASILIEEKNHDNRIIVIPGANCSITEKDIDENIGLIKEADIILTQLEIPLETVTYLSKIAKENNKIFVLNPAPGVPLKKELLENITYLTPNETELSLISGINIDSENTFFQACECLLKQGVENLLVTLGDKGVYLYNRNEKELIPAFKVKAVDTTAAGDCFNGAFCTFLSFGYPVRKAILNAEKASSICVTRRGAICSLPHQEELDILEA